MKRQKHSAAFLVSGVFLLCVIAPVGVSAHAGRHVYGSNTQVQSNTSTGDAAEIMDHALYHLTQRRAASRQYPVEVRQAECRQRANTLNGRIASSARYAQWHFQKLDGTYAKLQANRAGNPAAVAGGAAESAAAQRATEAKEAVAAHVLLAKGVDCTLSDPAVLVAAVQMGMVNAQLALQNYRQALIDYAASLRQPGGGGRP